MIKTLQRLATVLSVFSYSLLSAQGVCSYTQTAYGPDNSVFVEFNSFDCVDTVTNSFITQAEIGVASLGWNCPTWYKFDLEVNGVVVGSDLCEIFPTVDLSSYGVDINNLDSVKIVSKNGDSWVDNVNIVANLDLTYIVTSCPPPSGVMASNILPHSADITWASNGSETLWNMEVLNLTAGDTATGNPTYVGLTTGLVGNPYNMTGLSPDIEYAIYVQADCGPFDSIPQSDWSFAGTFITPPTCIPLGDISIDSITESSVYLSWAQAFTEVAWDIELINTSLIPADTFAYIPNNANLTTNAPILSGLLPSQNYELIVRANCGIIDGASVWTSVYSFTTLSLCQEPINFQVDSFTNDEISMSWTPIDNESAWDIEYVNITLSETASGTPDGTSTLTNYTAIGLDGDSEYELFVRANCGGADGESNWVGPIMVTTECNAFGVPFIDSVENHPTTTNSTIANCWESSPTGATNVFRWNIDGSNSTPSGSTGPSGAFSGSKYFYCEASQGDENEAVAMLYSPEFDISGVSYPTLSFMYHMYGEDMGTLFIDVLNDGIWHQNVFSLQGEQHISAAAPWLEANVNLASYTGVVQIRFRALKGSDFKGDIALDDIRVTNTDLCFSPSQLSVTNILPNTATLVWLENNTIAPAGGWLVEYGLEGFTPGTGTTVSTTDTFYNVTGLMPGTNYEFSVQAICTAGLDSSDWSTGPFITECTPVLNIETSFEDVTPEEVPNCWNLIDSTVSTSSYVRILSSTGFSNTGTMYLRYWHPTGATASSSLQFAVFPEVMTIAGYRLRFYGREGNNDENKLVVGTMSDPTDVNTFTTYDTISFTNQHVQYMVEFDNYTGTDTYVAMKGLMGSNAGSENLYLDDIEFHEIPNCYPPTITVDGTTTNSVSVTLDSVGTYATEWYVQLDDILGGTASVFDTVSTLSFTTTGLEPSTIYEMFIYSNCTDAISEAFPIEIEMDCAPIGDFTTSFESLSSGSDTLLCWDYTTVSSGNASVYVGSSVWSSYDGSKYIRLDGSNDPSADLFLITPELNNITAGTNIFTFWARSASSAQPSPFEVGTITDADDVSTFTPMYSGSVSTTYDSIVVPFVSYAGSDTRIAIKFLPLTTFDRLYVDMVRWEQGPDCELPVTFTVDYITDEEASLEWLNVSPDTAWYLELVDVLDTLDVYDSIPTDTAYINSFIMDGLTENTIYDVYLTNPCDTALGAIQLTMVTPWANDLGVSSILSPLTEGCNVSDSVQIEIEISNFGGQPQTGFMVDLGWTDSTVAVSSLFNDTIQPAETVSFILDGYYDFSSAIDSAFYVQTVLPSDSSASNNMISTTVTNLGITYVELIINTVSSGASDAWKIKDSLNNYVIAEDGDIDGSGNLSSNTTYTYDVCVFPNMVYELYTYDQYGNGWGGGTYEINRCGGILVANNDGNPVDNGVDSGTAWELEGTEVFIVEECPDYDLALVSVDSLETSCGLGIETGYVQIANYGNFDVGSNAATAQYQFNNSGLWIDFWNFDGGLASQSDTLYQLPDIDMTLPGNYTIDIQIVYAQDEDMSSNNISFGLTSVPNLTQDSTGFESDNGYWYSEINTGTNDSWEWGIPTTANIGNGNTGKVWATKLNGNAELNEYSYLYSPCYDISNYTNPVEFSFDYIRPESSHVFRLQRSFNGGVNWYTWPSNQVPQSNTTDWTKKVIVLPNSIIETEVIFRWRYSTWNNGSAAIEGFAFDNWELKEHVPNIDASLMELTVNNDTVSDPVVFDPVVFNYNYEVPYGATNWDVDAVYSAPNIYFITSMTITEPASLPGVATVVVVAEDTNYVSTYTINITEAPAATDATLSSLSVSNSPVSGFNPDTLCYNMTYPYGSAFTPSVTAVTTDQNATVAVTNVAIPGTALVTVTAEDGVTTNVYCINYEVEALSTNALMADILMDAVSLPGFVANTYWYYVTLPNGTTSMPFMTYVPADANAIVNYLPAAMPLTDTAIFEVTAQDGVTIETYYVVFDEAPSNNANLLDLTINGGTVAGFDATVIIYDIELAYNAPIPNLSAIAEDSEAIVDIVDAPSVPGTSIVTVTAEDGSQLVYYVNWSYAAPNDDATLDSLMTNVGYFCIITGSDTTAAMELSTVDESTYNLTVGVGFTSLVNMTVVPTDPNATVVLSGSATVAPYGVIIITVTAQDGSTQAVYTINVISDDCSIGLDETILNQINVSPNPSNGTFFIETPTDLNDYTISVVDQIGKVVYKEVVVEATMEKVMDLSTLPSGMYNMRISTASDFIVKRISIIK